MSIPSCSPASVLSAPLGKWMAVDSVSERKLMRQILSGLVLGLAQANAALDRQTQSLALLRLR